MYVCMYIYIYIHIVSVSSSNQKIFGEPVRRPLAWPRRAAWAADGSEGPGRPRGGGGSLVR